MSLTRTINQLKPTIARHTAALVAAHARQPAIAPYATTSALLAAIDQSSDLGAKPRAALIAALLSEHQRAPSPLWQAVLLVAFQPMLARIRKILGKPKDEDLDQKVLLAFLDAARTVSVEHAASYAPLALRWATQSAVFGTADHDAIDDAFEADLEGWDPSGTAPQWPIFEAGAADVARALDAHDVDEEIVNVVLATCAGDESIVEYVDRVHERDTPELRRACAQKLRRERAVILERLRDHLSGDRRAA